MASKSWNPFGVSLTIEATSATVTRTAADKYTVKINAKWACTGASNKTDYGMTASSGGGSISLNTQGTKAHDGSGSFTGTYSISGNGSATKTITVTFRNYNDWHDDSKTTTVTFNVTVPAWTSYTVTYNANNGTGAPAKQTKWKGQSLTLSSTKPTRTGYSFKNWNTASGGTGTSYAPGDTYSADDSVTLYAQWTANTFTVTYNANGGTDGPSKQTKTYGVTLTLSTSKPTRTNYTFKGWSTSASSTTVSYNAGGSYTNNANATLYAVWELSYTKPRIYNVNVNRTTPWANNEGEDNDAEGLSFTVFFDWETDLSDPKYRIRWKKDTESWSASTSSNELSLSGTNGSTLFSKLFDTTNTDEISVEHTYDVEITLIDDGGSYTVYATIPTLIMALDVYPDSIAYLHFESYTEGGINNRFYYDTSKFTHEPGHMYTLSFSARSESDDTLLVYNVGGQYNQKGYSLSTSWQSYTYTYKASNEGSLTFYMYNKGVVDITNIELRESGRMYSLLAANASTSTDYWTKVGNDSTNYLVEQSEKMGLGVAIGKTAESPNLFDVNLPSRFRDDVDFDSSIKAGSSKFTGSVYISNSGKTAHNDGKTGWYFGTDATAHATHTGGGTGIYFHYAGVSSNTSHIREKSSGVLEVNNKLIVNGSQNILWTGGYYMTAGHKAPLSEAVSSQLNGIILVFSRYSSGSQDDSFNTCFVSKKFISTYGSKGISFLLTANGDYGITATKYLYIADSEITGHEKNNTSGTLNGISYTNNSFVLRAVYGV